LNELPVTALPSPTIPALSPHVTSPHNWIPSPRSQQQNYMNLFRSECVGMSPRGGGGGSAINTDSYFKKDTDAFVSAMLRGRE